MSDTPPSAGAVAWVLPAVADTVGTVLGLPPTRLTAHDPHAPLANAIPELDSLALVAVLGALEDRFGIHLDEALLEPEALHSLAALAALVVAHGADGA